MRPKTTAAFGVTVCMASGRRRVRRISVSMSRSTQQLSALALPAER